MTQLFRLTLDGVDITDKVSKCHITNTMNRAYSVATFSYHIADVTLLDKPIFIEYGSSTFTGFVFTTSKIAEETLNIECRTNGAKLTQPYSPSKVILEEATTTHELAALYASQSGVNIHIDTEDINFGGSYQRNGTPINALTNAANITGAEIWEDELGIRIEPNKAIDSDGFILTSNDIFDFVPSSRSVYNNGVGFITICNRGSESTDIISQNGIYAEIDECSGEVFVYPNPYGEIEEVTGIPVLTPAIIERKEDFNLLDEVVINLEGAISEIISITLNGTPITNHNFVVDNNIIYFETLQRGTLTVVYNAKCFRGYANIAQTPIGRSMSFDMFYLDQGLRFFEFLEEDCLNLASDGDMTCLAPGEMYYNHGFDIWTIGGDPEFTFYANNVPVIRSVDTVAMDYISIEEATLEPDGTGWKYKARFPIAGNECAESSSVDVPFTIDGDYFKFTTYYPIVKISYSTPASRHFVMFGKVDHATISMVIRNKNTDTVCEYIIDSQIDCEVGQTVPVDLNSQLGTAPANFVGLTLNIRTPSGSSITGTVDCFGIVDVLVSIDGKYVIDTSGIRGTTKRSVILTSNTGA